MTDAREVIARTTHSWRVLNFNAAEREADAIIAALSAAGLVIVPKEPTEKMVNAAIDKDSCIFGVTAVCVWRAMVEASQCHEQ